MDQAKVRQSLTPFIRKLKHQVKIEKVILFGSFVDGAPMEDSDLDVLVVSKDFSGQDEDARLNVLYHFSRFTSPEIHPWGVTPQELEQASRLTTIGNARESGRVVFERNIIGSCTTASRA